MELAAGSRHEAAQGTGRGVSLNENGGGGGVRNIGSENGRVGCFMVLLDDSAAGCETSRKILEELFQVVQFQGRSVCRLGPRAATWEGWVGWGA